LCKLVSCTVFLPRRTAAASTSDGTGVAGVRALMPVVITPPPGKLRRRAEFGTGRRGYNGYAMLAKDDDNERVCENEVCACTLASTTLSDFCSEYCQTEGIGRGDGACQCGHIGCA